MSTSSSSMDHATNEQASSSTATPNKEKSSAGKNIRAACTNKRPRTPSNDNDDASSSLSISNNAIPLESSSLLLSSSSFDDPEESLSSSLPRTKVPRSSSSSRLCSDASEQNKHKSAPLAPSITHYLKPGGTVLYRPRPEWLFGTAATAAADEQEQRVRVSQNGVVYNSSKPTVFGKDWDSALHVAIRENATEAALALLQRTATDGSSSDNNKTNNLWLLTTATNCKGVTPLILASQKGNITVVKELLKRGADPAIPSLNGTTAVLQAAHFGHANVLELLLLRQKRNHNNSVLLVEQANSNHTTPLMRAAQEGHCACVQLLLQAGASVNRRNRERMSALMLASQRGHAQICQLLIQHGADLEAKTASQDSTSLLLACKRGHLETVRVLVTAGCEVCVTDSRGRSAQQIIARRRRSSAGAGGGTVGNKELMDLLDPVVQIDLLRQQAAQQRNFDMIKLWHLLQTNRATVIDNDTGCGSIGIHDISASALSSSNQQQQQQPLFQSCPSTQALLRTMVLPAPLVESIALFLPPPNLWARRIAMLTTSRSAIAPDAAVIAALDLIDEVLEEGGFVEACDLANVPPPSTFRNWAEWKAWGIRGRNNNNGSVAAVTVEQQQQQQQRFNVTTAVAPAPRDPERPTVLELRRKVGYLQTLAKYQNTVGRLLLASPYNMPESTLQQLVTVADVASLTRRMNLHTSNNGSTTTRGGGVHFETVIAMDLIMLTSRLCSWYWRERQGTTATTTTTATPAVTR